jgi:hypothetical protein
VVGRLQGRGPRESTMSDVEISRAAVDEHR